MNTVNPFLSSIVADPWDADLPDVPSIHAAAFEVCRESLANVCRTGHTRSVLIHGEPGSGKTHLLSRLRRYLTSESNPSPMESADVADFGASDESPRLPHPPAVFSGIRLRSGSRMICRHVRQALVRDLLRPSDHGFTQLEWLIIYRAAPHVTHPERAHAWWGHLRHRRRAATAEQEAEELFRRLDRDYQLGRNLTTVLVHLALGRHLREVRDWLVEGRLPDEVLGQLQLIPPAEEVDVEEEALDVIYALSRLAGPGMPLVIGFDQVEALQLHSRDLEGPFAFGRMISALHDRTRHTLLITGVQSTFLEMLDASIRAADLDRLREAMAVLEPLDVSQAQVLVAQRLRTADWLRGRREAQSDPCWPIGSERIRQYLESSQTGTRTARRLIAFCGDRFLQWQQGGPVPAAPAEQFLERRFDAQFEEALRQWRPSRSDETLLHGLPMVLEFLREARAFGPSTGGGCRADAPANAGPESKRPESNGPAKTGPARTGPARTGPASAATQRTGAPGTGAPGRETAPASASAPNGTGASKSVASRGTATGLEEQDWADIDLVVSPGPGRILVSVCNGSGNGLTGRLKRLRRLAESNAAPGLVLLRDARIPWPPTARKAREHLEALGRRGVHVVRPTAEAIAALEALRGLLSDAKAGDLAHDGHTLSASTVQQWLAENLPASLKELLQDVAPDGENAGSEAAANSLADSAADSLYDDILALLQQRHVIRVTEVAEQLDRDVEQVARCLGLHRAAFGTLSGPPAVVFERIAASS